MLLTKLVSHNKMSVIHFIVVSAIFCSVATHRNSTDFLEWFKDGIISDVPTFNLTKFGNKSYYIEAILTANYYQATQFCIFHKMRLLTITSQAEHEFLENTILKLGISKYHFWTSGTTLPSNYWVWMSTGRPIVYTNWGKGEPNGAGGNEQCIEMRIVDDGLRWNDVQCSSKDFFICEYPSTNLIKKQNGNSAEIGSHLGKPPTAHLIRKKRNYYKYGK